MRARNIGTAKGYAQLALLSLLFGCGGRDAERGSCVALQAPAIYFGSGDPEPLTMSAEQRNAIGGVAPVAGGSLCTGVAIRERWVLTAAHCDTGDALSFHSSGSGARPIPVIATAVHPELDVMLLELASAQLAPPLAAIEVLETDIGDDWVGVELTLAGVGETESGSSGELRFASEPVVDVTELEIAVDGMGSSGACLGDSGGPILVAARDGSPRVAGTLDRGSRSCTGLDLYVRADRFRAWATEVIGSAGCDAD